MNRAVSKDLVSLLPTLPSAPPELIELASSLLAQSRSKAASLKQEEEVARSYACAHLACERLKTRLDLPAVVARPPCPPRVYKKLYAFLDSALAARSPRKRQREADDDDEVPTPTKRSAPTRKRRAEGEHATAQAGIPPDRRKTSQGRGDSRSDGGLEFMIPMIRGICDALGSKACTPHVYTGVCTQAAADTIEEGQLPALVVGIAVVVVKRLGRRLAARPFETGAARLLDFGETLSRLGISTEEERLFIDAVAAESSKVVKANESEWRRTDWFQTIESQVPEDEDDLADDLGLENSGPAGQDDDDLTAVTASRRPPTPSKRRMASKDEDNQRLRPGLGTMFCDAVDWLSVERRAAYKIWRRDILIRIDGLA